MPSKTHDNLVDAALEWLLANGSYKLPVTGTELRAFGFHDSGEIPDLILWGDPGISSTIVEAKATYADFVNDWDKAHRQEDHLGCGNLRFYICPTKMISPEEMAITRSQWGILWMNKDGEVSEMKPSGLCVDINWKRERQLMYAAATKTGDGKAITGAVKRSGPHGLSESDAATVANIVQTCGHCKAGYALSAAGLTLSNNELYKLVKVGKVPRVTITKIGGIRYLYPVK